MSFKEKLKDNFGKLIIVVFFALFALAIHVLYLMRSKHFNSFNIMCIVVGIVLFCLVLAEFYLAYFKEWPIYRLYLVAGIVLGIVFMFIIPPYATPDERTHTGAAVHVSNVLMGYGEPDDGINNLYMRNTEYGLRTSEYMKKTEYKNFLEDISFTTSAQENELVATILPYPGPFALYIIPGIGITIGRLLGFSGTATILLATLFNVLFFVISTAFAIKIIPFGKEVIMVIALFPMVLQLTSSLSYDNAVLTSFIMVIALELKWCYAKNIPVTRKEIIVLLLYGSILCLVKGGIYAMFLLLPFVCNSSKATLKNIWHKYKYWIIAGVVLLLAILGRNVISSVFSSLFAGASSNAAVVESSDAVQAAQASYSIWDNNYISWAGEEGYSIKFLLQHPLDLIIILLNTIIENLSYYTSGMVAAPLGWLNINVPWFYILAYVIVLFMATIKPENTPDYFKTRDRIWIMILGLVSMGLAAAAMLIYWTPATYGSIAGIQGRYFIPPVIMMVLCARNGLITTKKKITSGLLMTTLILGMISVFYVLYTAII